MAQIAAGQITDSASVRDYLTHALRLDLIGPRPDDAELAYEMLPHAPSRWYLTGFLLPSECAGVPARPGRRRRIRPARRSLPR